MEALAVRDLLHEHAEVHLWSPATPHPSYGPHFIETIVEAEERHPSDGTLVLVGGYYELGDWLKRASFQRIILKYNSYTHLRFFAWLGELEAAGLPRPDLVFPSSLLRGAIAMDGLIEPSPIDIAHFRPEAHPDSGRFVVGRLSRDTLGKHHEDDPSLYRMLAQQGCRIRIMGGACLEEYLRTDAQGIELLPAGTIEAAEFLRGLDCFFYRTGTFLESFGRVVLEAMASGLPVVCHRRGGYTEWIRHGENGYLFDTQEEAFDLLAMLQNRPEERLRTGGAARETAESLFGAEARERRRKWYLGG